MHPSRYTLPKPKSVAAKCMFSTIQAALQYAASCLLSGTPTQDHRGRAICRTQRRIAQKGRAAPVQFFQQRRALDHTQAHVLVFTHAHWGSVGGFEDFVTLFIQNLLWKIRPQDRRRLIASMTSIETASCLHFLWQRSYAAYFRIRIIDRFPCIHTKRIEFFASAGHSWSDMLFP